MVRLPDYGEMAKKTGVKMEIEDQLEEEHGPMNKRPKLVTDSRQGWKVDSTAVAPKGGNYSLLDEPSPLGLRLRKSPSLLELIQMKLNNSNSATDSCVSSAGTFNSGKKKDIKSTAISVTPDKIKASNFAASLLRIGTWECVSRYEGDLVAKCYYAKHKLVWEVLEGGLKSKIEIQWSDITAIKAAFPDNGPATLDVVLARQPLFFKETNPQPRKHTLWQATSDFTGGQASIHRRHFLQCPQGLLNKHFEKLVQCDPRLNALSQQPEIILESPYFESRESVFEEDEYRCQDFRNYASPCAVPSTSTSFQGFQDSASPCTAPSTSTTNELRDPFGAAPGLVAMESRSPSSVMDARIIEDNSRIGLQGPKNLTGWGQFRFPGLRPSMSKQDLVSHMEHCISEQTNGAPNGNLPTKAVLEDLADFLLSDSHATPSEEGLMSRVNSFCCLLQGNNTAQNPPQTSNLQDIPEHSLAMNEQGSERKSLLEISRADEQTDSPTGKRPSVMSHKESFGDLLLSLPRIASMPQFLFNMYEDSESQAR